MKFIKTKDLDETELVIFLKQQLIDKINSEWALKWNKKFPIEKFNLSEISKNKFPKLLRNDIFTSIEKQKGRLDAQQMIISIDTLKRLLDTDKAGKMQNNTKECIAIYLSYSSWNDFVKKKSKSTKLVFGHKKYLVIYGLIFFVLGMLFIVSIFAKKHSIKVQIKQIRQNDTTQSLPRTFYFAYKIPSPDSETYFECLPHPYSGGKELLLKSQGTIGLTYFNYHIVHVLLYNNSGILNSFSFPISTPGWIARYSVISDSLHQKYYTKNIANNSFLSGDTLYWIPQENLPQNSSYWIKYQKFENYQIFSDNFCLSFDFINNEGTKGIPCYDMQTRIYFSNNEYLYCNLLKNNCLYYASLLLNGQKIIDGKHSINSQLLAFDPQKKHQLEIDIKNNYLRLYIDKKTRIDTLIKIAKAEIIGLEFATKGSGKIYNISLNF